MPLNRQERLRAAIPQLVTWYRDNRRTLPWREAPDPYHIWISEIMLQQTRIEAVIPYYARFMAAFPTVSALAEAEEDRLLKLWEGLGYYSRARNLKKSAEILVRDHNGQLPRTVRELKSLPGIGDYTAGAIASIAYQEPAPAVDGNVLRVLSRLFASSEDILLQKTKTEMTALLESVYPTGEESALFTEGLMELGEVVCIPNGEPKCGLCPLQALCLAHKTDTTGLYPVKSVKKPRRIENRTVLLLSCGGKYAICKRENKGLLRGLWELPNLDGHRKEAEMQGFLEEKGVKIRILSPCGKATHIFSHVEWHMTGWRAETDREIPLYVWKTVEEILRDYPIPTAFKFYTKQLTE